MQFTFLLLAIRRRCHWTNFFSDSWLAKEQRRPKALHNLRNWKRRRSVKTGANFLSFLLSLSLSLFQLESQRNICGQKETAASWSAICVWVVVLSQEKDLKRIKSFILPFCGSDEQRISLKLAHTVSNYIYIVWVLLCYAFSPKIATTNHFFQDSIPFSSKNLSCHSFFKESTKIDFHF